MNEIKSGKAPGLDGFPVECSKKGGMAALEWLVRLLLVMQKNIFFAPCFFLLKKTHFFKIYMVIKKYIL